MKFENDTETGIKAYMARCNCDRETAIADLLDVGIGRVAALDRHSKSKGVKPRAGKGKRKAA